MNRVTIFAVLVCIWSSAAFAQQRETAPKPPEGSTLNKLDQRGNRHGMWLNTKEPRLGEPGVREFGKYEHGNKLGTWYKIDPKGDLVAIENYRNNVLDGEVKYYDQGRLYCTGHYRGLNTRNAYDTIVVVHPISQEEQYRVISTEQGTLRHGTWQYYDPANGRLLKLEEYQVDELVYRKDYAAEADSMLRKRHEANMPHNKTNKVVLPAGKKVSYTEY